LAEQLLAVHAGQVEVRDDDVGGLPTGDAVQRGLGRGVDHHLEVGGEEADDEATRATSSST